MSRGQKGVVSVEAILSFALLLVTLLLFWSAVRLIYEKTSLETAAQMGAQGGLTYYLRNAPISCKPSSSFGNPDRCQIGKDGADKLAQDVFKNNICDNDRAIGQEIGENLDSCDVDDPITLIQCRLINESALPGPWRGWEEAGCDISGTGTVDPRKTAKALIIRFSLQGQVDAEGGIAADILNAVLPGGVFETEAEAYGWRRLN